MVIEGSGKKSDGSSSLPPRKINVQKFSEARATELESLHSIVSDRLNKDFRSKRNQRRRTTSYNNRAANRRGRKRQKPESFSVKANSSESGDHEAKVPRRVRRRIELKRNPELGFSTSGDATKRLRTHVWHAKRFTMTKLWGFHLPLGLHGRGRGSRAVLKRLREGVLVHDASYHAAVQLEGPEGSLLSILDTLMKPSPSSHSKEVSNSILKGRTYGSAMLHQVGSPVSQPIAPVIYMWRPYHFLDKGYDDKESNDLGIDGLSENTSRKCWVWIHASSFSEGYDSLKLACEEQMKESGVTVNCFSLEGRLAKLEILGSKASQLLEKTLYPVTCLEQSSLEKSDYHSEVKNTTNLHNEDTAPHCAILARSVMDPRIAPKNSHDNINDPVEMVTKAEPDNLEEVFKCLWDASSELNPPEEESTLCWEKYQSRMDFFCLDSISEVPRTSKSPSSTRACPVLLLKHNKPTGWSLILPLSWVKVFWNTFVSKGAHAIGQREKRWIACDAGLPFFPSDFPECNAYVSSAKKEAAELEQKRERRPLAIRPFKIPIPHPWNSILSNPKCTAAPSTVNEKNESELTAPGYNLFDGIVARTSAVLKTAILGISSGDNFFLSPQVSNGHTKVMTQNMPTLVEKVSSHINHGNKLCLVRVLLHAYKEGSFEDRAVVCAPFLKDLSLWLDSEREVDRLSIPQSWVKSYFQEQPCGMWELNVPEDSLSKESHRWPIGFVTTGFVRGSKKAMAVALCDVELLARLREEQWRDKAVKRRKKEIYVLVRNLRSSTYRLALASIVLDQQDYDVDCL